MMIIAIICIVVYCVMAWMMSYIYTQNLKEMRKV